MEIYFGYKGCIKYKVWETLIKSLMRCKLPEREKGITEMIYVQTATEIHLVYQTIACVVQVNLGKW